MRFNKELIIEDPRNHSPEAVTTLYELLAGAAGVTPDPKRPNFYELEDGSDVYYIHVSPVTGHILLLATWKKDWAPAAVPGSPRAA